MPSNIPYCDEGWNPVSGCTPCSPGCLNCYAKATAQRFPAAHAKPCPTLPEECVVSVPFSEVVLHPDRLEKPLHWRKPRVVMVPTMGDLFHEDVPDEFIERVFAAMNGSYDSGRFRYSDHTFLVLTKRPERMRDFLADWLRRGENGDSLIPFPFPPANVWLGATVVNQQEADAKIPILLSTPAAHYWCSVEPILGPVDLTVYLPLLGKRCWDGGTCHHECTPKTGCFRKQCCGPLSEPDHLLDQVIVGCESGPKRRHARDTWFRTLREQCAEAGVPFYLKQAEEWQGLAFPKHNTPHGVGKVIHYVPKPGELAWR